MLFFLDTKINYKIYAQTYRVGHTRDLGHDNDIKVSINKKLCSSFLTQKLIYKIMLKPMKHMGHTRDLRHNNDIFKKSISTKSMPKPTE